MRPSRYLSPEKRAEILQAGRKPGVSRREVAAQFGVTESTVSKIVRSPRSANPTPPPDSVDECDEWLTVSLAEFWRIKRENLAYADAILSSPPSGNP